MHKNNVLLLASLALFIVLSFGVASHANAASYFVATNGNDANSCTKAQNTATAKRTISSGVSCVQPGDTLLLRAGTYTTVSLGSIILRGAPNTWISIKSYPGEKAIVNGGLIFYDSSYIEVADLEITDLSFSYSSYAGNSCGVFDTACQIRSRPCDPMTVACQDQYGAMNNGKGQWTRNGIYVNNSNPMIFRNLDIHDMFGNGIAGGGGTGKSEPYSRIQVLNNHIHNLGRRGFFNTSYCTYITGGDYTIRGNICHDTDGSDGFRLGSGYGINQNLRNSLVENNVSYNNGGQHVYVYADSSAPGGRNASFREGGSGFTFNGDGTNNIIRNNIAYGNRHTGIAFCGQTVGSLHIYNNIAFGNGYVGMGSSCGDKSTVRNNISYGNNLLFGSGSGYDFSYYHGSPILENNLYGTFFADPTSNSTFKNNIVGQDPRFVNAASRDFHLQSGSPAINAGVIIPGFTGSYIGSAPDIGACEYGSGFPCPPSGSNGGTPPPTKPPVSSCSNLLNSTTAVPTSFGASFNWLSSAKELLMNVICSGSSATANIGNG
ncbi:MAG: right-handed parallel beta-helix repeat-containing protein, partial [bacterium]|nr:right-handed parallel beta-helix repeat-containing protein [bacterium]